MTKTKSDLAMEYIAAADALEAAGVEIEERKAARTMLAALTHLTDVCDRAKVFAYDVGLARAAIAQAKAAGL